MNVRPMATVLQPPNNWYLLYCDCCTLSLLFCNIIILNFAPIGYAAQLTPTPLCHRAIIEVTDFYPTLPTSDDFAATTLQCVLRYHTQPYRGLVRPGFILGTSLKRGQVPNTRQLLFLALAWRLPYP